MAATRRTRRPKDEPPPIEDQIHDMDENLLACRDLRHAWSIETSYHAVAVEGGARGGKYLERRLACLRCDTHRVELVRIHPSWIERISVYYVYPEGYQIKGVRRGDDVQGIVRMEQYRRVMEAAG
jgi:hypothetical protein